MLNLILRQFELLFVFLKTSNGAIVWIVDFDLVGRVCMWLSRGGVGMFLLGRLREGREFAMVGRVHADIEPLERLGFVLFV